MAPDLHESHVEYVTLLSHVARMRNLERKSRHMLKVKQDICDVRNVVQNHVFLSFFLFFFNTFRISLK